MLILDWGNQMVLTLSSSHYCWVYNKGLNICFAVCPNNCAKTIMCLLTVLLQAGNWYNLDFVHKTLSSGPSAS